MRDYEVIFIIRGTESEEAAAALTDQMQEVARQQGAELVEAERWGRRKLAYDIAKQREGIYVLFRLKAEAAAITELERKFKMNDAVIRFLTVRVDDELRRSSRRAILRAKRKGTEVGAPPAPRQPARPRVEREEPTRVEPEEEEGEAEA